MFRFNQAVTTPDGPATFIGKVWHIETDDNTGEEKIVVDGYQVSHYVPMRELSQDEREHLSPAILKLDREQLSAWLKSAKVLRNEIYPLDQVTG